jgi:hypothetical protein
MKKSYPVPSTRLSQQALELSIAAPQVVARRLARMALAGANPSASDQKEFRQMSDEKVTAFYQSWTAIWAQMYRSQFAIAQTMMSAVTSAMVAGKQPSAASTFSAMSRETSKVLSAGIAPVHRAAVSNAKRLSGGK